MHKIAVIGVDSFGIGAEQRERIEQAALLVAGGRLLELVGLTEVPTVAITPLKDAFTAMKESLYHGNVVVLASGDPLFFGIGRRLLQEFTDERVEFYPALSSMQEAFARFRVPWDDAKIVSLHGRTDDHVPGLLLTASKSCIFTDDHNSPDRLARKCIAYCEKIGHSDLLQATRVMVAEQLGAADEKITEGSLEEIAAKTFDPLNIMCLLTPWVRRKNCFGLNETDITHSRGLITKDEVRAATLHKLRLPQKGIFWDMGAGSGSISIEAACMNPELTVYALERKDEELSNIKKNIRYHCCYNVIPVAGDAALTCPNLPEPDAVFIGGSGGRLAELITEASKRLPSGGRLVVNGVIERTVRDAPRIMQENYLTVSSAVLQVRRFGGAAEPVDFNPITIMVGVK